ncbi:hypothetical protein ZYGR_0P03260 [Zygosaccharomyces rouxii]|uniref:ZYRO0E08052p n=2 Tax=Zygosaccharomyces rouxii TaxID=4956 RepID=C5E4Q9_ZYGRC|nr:uncharacterized protein ZYRO0E08052g [Zygosaccharomyces rouxii]KAH9198124.1 hypothetical protein LQ764DRAFT_146630 [Zygosaccharomyces rouxii]GAV49680.1 hypothetical protein ZYGR_0P03260 [Zygosaccharomyces rouxii]CAR31020.1 ZYRO0E08052p [Zygosaccharomyces rouxii]
MFKNPFKQDCTCWICLEESNFDSAWIRHECGCNLQVHKLCYLHWLYSINRNYISRNLVTKNFNLVTEDDLKRTICYLVDGHRNLHREVSLSEFLNTLPFIRSKSNEPMSSSVGIMSLLGINYTISFRIVRSPMALPVEFADCPQCKNHVVNQQITFTSRSFFLAIFYWTKSVIRNTTIALTLVLSTLNIGKWWFKIGLWQLRCIFPENVLRVILDISTTRALNVYGETMNGLVSIPQMTRFLIFGFPVCLMGVRSSYPTLNRFRWLYTLVLSVRAGHYDPKATRLLSRTLTTCNICMLLNSAVITPFLSRYYEYLVKAVTPYFCPIDKSLDVFPSQGYGNVIIKTSWYDVLFESIVWPAFGSLVGGKLFDAVTWIQREFGLNWTPSCSPNDCRMVFNFVGCGLTAVARQLLNMWASHMRAKELKQLQESIEENTQ